MVENTGPVDDDIPPGTLVKSPVLRWTLFGFGCLFVATGVIGILVPGLPTTVFLLAAAWAFSRSSERLQHWLWNHKRLGPPVRDWYRHRVIPVRAKIVAVMMMAFGVVYVAIVVPHEWAWAALLAILVPVACYLLTRASSPPAKMAPSGQSSVVAD